MQCSMNIRSWCPSRGVQPFPKQTCTVISVPSVSGDSINKIRFRLLGYGQEIHNNCVVGNFLACKEGICYAFVKMVDEFLYSFTRWPAVDDVSRYFQLFPPLLRRHMYWSQNHSNTCKKIILGLDVSCWRMKARLYCSGISNSNLSTKARFMCLNSSLFFFSSCQTPLIVVLCVWVLPSSYSWIGRPVWTHTKINFP